MSTTITDVSRERQSKGEQIAKAGGVTKGDGEYTVVESLRVGSATSRVFKDGGAVKCNCLDFFKGSQQNPAFLCEHIYAVRAWASLQSAPAATSSQPSAGQPTSGNSAPAAIPAASASDSKSAAPVLPATPQVTSNPAPANSAPVSGPASSAPVNSAPANPAPVSGPVSGPAAPSAAGVLETLNGLNAGWSSKISSISALGNLVTVVVTLTVGDNSRDGVGVGSLTIKGIYDAELAALEHAAARFSK